MDPRPQPGSPALTSSLTAPDDGFFTPVAYKGAFNDVNWASDWGFAAEAGLISGEAAGVPRAPARSAVHLPALLTIVQNGSNISITFASQSGVSYQVQSKADLSAEWSNEGAELAGTGGTLAYPASVGASQKFFRVACH